MSSSPPPSRRRLLTALVVAFLLAAGGVYVALCVQKQRALAFHTRDFLYYLQVSSKVFDPASDRVLSLNPHGHSVLGFEGDDGVTSIHQAVHLEPVKYVAGLLYRLAPSPGPLFAAFTAFLLLPPLYLWICRRAAEGAGAAFVVLWIGLYVLYPSVPAVVTNDLRPATLLMPAFLLSFLSVHHARPRWEALLFFNAMFAMREEALILGLAVLLYVVVLARRRREGYRACVGPLAVSWLAWLGVALAYFRWTGYPSAGSAATNPVVAMLAACAVYGSFLVLVDRRRPMTAERLRLLALAPAAAPLAGYFLFEYDGARTPAAILDHLLHGARPSLHAGTALLFALPLFESARRRGARRLVVGGAALVLAGFGALTTSDLLHRFPAYARGAEEARVVFDVRGRTDRASTEVLTDYAAAQAFFDYENLFVYQRLPWSLARGDARFYPENRELLVDLLRRRVDYVVVSAAERGLLLDLLAEAGAREELEVLHEGGAFSAYRLRRSGRASASSLSSTPAITQ